MGVSSDVWQFLSPFYLLTGQTMITCNQCGNTFLPVWRERYPGGADTCATILLWASAQLFVGAILGAVGFYFNQHVFYLFAVLFILMSVLKVASIPENMRIILDHGGNICPKCGASNDLHWYD